MVSGNMRIDTVWFVVVDLTTDHGPSGRSYIWGFSKAGSDALCSVIEHLSSVTLGEDPFYTTRLWGAMWRALIQWGHAGIPVMGMAAIDAAVWDIVGRAAGQPLCNLLGRKLDRVPAYASALWITDDLAALAKEAAGHVEAGFRAMKMRVGRHDLAKDVAAVKAVREAIGPGVDLMVDFSSVPTRAEATRLAHALEPFDLCWIEDPVVDENMEDHAQIAREIRTPICFGEKVYAPQGLKQVIDANAGDVLMADMQRAGGVTGWNRIAAMADAARLPLSSHILPELNVHLIASAPTGFYLEYMTWGEELFEEKMDLKAGTVGIPDRPGFGLVWNEERLAHYTMRQQTFPA
jgi:mandelate racemase